MKITKREQVLLGVLLLVLLGYSYYNFIYTKQIQKIAELKVSRDTYSQKWEQVKAKIASKDKKNQQYITLKDKISNETRTLFPSIKQEEIIVVLDKMIKDSNLQAEVLGFSDGSSTTTPVDTNKTVNNEDKTKAAANELDKLVSAFNGDSKKDANSEKTSNSKTNTNTNKSIVTGAYKMQVTFNFKGIYDEFIKFIDEVENYDKKIIIDNINLVGAEGRDVSGTIILEFYGVPKLDNNDYFKWDYKKPIGNENPFVGSSSSLQGNSEIITNSEAQDSNGIITKKEGKVIESDFITRAKPITSDLHTLTIKKAKDESMQSYIYSDNEEIELVEFYFTKTDNKYFYKYKTSRETYPKDFNKSIEFVPNGENIMLDIVSQKRDLGSDLSGANIKIINDTDKSVVVSILDDDKIKPRVKIIKEKGNILVNRNYIYYSDK